MPFGAFGRPTVTLVGRKAVGMTFPSILQGRHHLLHLPWFEVGHVVGNLVQPVGCEFLALDITQADQGPGGLYYHVGEQVTMMQLQSQPVHISPQSIQMVHGLSHHHVRATRIVLVAALILVLL